MKRPSFIIIETVLSNPQQLYWNTSPYFFEKKECLFSEKTSLNIQSKYNQFPKSLQGKSIFSVTQLLLPGNSLGRQGIRRGGNGGTVLRDRFNLSQGP